MDVTVRHICHIYSITLILFGDDHRLLAAYPFQSGIPRFFLSVRFALPALNAFFLRESWLVTSPAVKNLRCL